MRSKDYIETKLATVKNTVQMLHNDVENNKQYITQQYLLEKLSAIIENLELVSNRLDLED